jgi:hypothetical protein
VGGYWTRSNKPEIDVVIADRRPIAKHIHAVGSITWRRTPGSTPTTWAAAAEAHARLPSSYVDDQWAVPMAELDAELALHEGHRDAALQIVEACIEQCGEAVCPTRRGRCWRLLPAPPSVRTRR